MRHMALALALSLVLLCQSATPGLGKHASMHMMSHLRRLIASVYRCARSGGFWADRSLGLAGATGAARRHLLQGTPAPVTPNEDALRAPRRYPWGGSPSASSWCATHAQTTCSLQQYADAICAASCCCEQQSMITAHAAALTASKHGTACLSEASVSCAEHNATAGPVRLLQKPSFWCCAAADIPYCPLLSPPAAWHANEASNTTATPPAGANGTSNGTSNGTTGTCISRPLCALCTRCILVGHICYCIVLAALGMQAGCTSVLDHQGFVARHDQLGTALFFWIDNIRSLHLHDTYSQDLSS